MVAQETTVDLLAALPGRHGQWNVAGAVYVAGGVREAEPAVDHRMGSVRGGSELLARPRHGRRPHWDYGFPDVVVLGLAIAYRNAVVRPLRQQASIDADEAVADAHIGYYSPVNRRCTTGQARKQEPKRSADRHPEGTSDRADAFRAIRPVVCKSREALDDWQSARAANLTSESVAYLRGKLYREERSARRRSEERNFKGSK